MFRQEFCSAVAIALFACTVVAQPSNLSTAPTKKSPPQPVKLIEINSAARVSFLEGDATIVGTNKKSRKASVGETIFEGDSLVTGKVGEIHLEMEDSGFVAVRPGTRVQIGTFLAKGDTRDASTITLAYGGIRVVNGWIGKQASTKSQFMTPSSTIQIHAGDHEIRVVPKVEDSGRLNAGTYYRAIVGGGQMISPKGVQKVAATQIGFVDRESNMPTLLVDQSWMLNATKNEKQIDGKYDFVQKNVEARLDARRNEMKMRLENSEKFVNSQKTAPSEPVSNKK